MLLLEHPGDHVSHGPHLGLEQLPLTLQTFQQASDDIAAKLQELARQTGKVAKQLCTLGDDLAQGFAHSLAHGLRVRACGTNRRDQLGEPSPGTTHQPNHRREHGLKRRKRSDDHAT